MYVRTKLVTVELKRVKLFYLVEVMKEGMTDGWFPDPLAEGAPNGKH